MSKILLIENQSNNHSILQWLSNSSFVVETTTQSVYQTDQRCADNYDLILLHAAHWTSVSAWIKQYRQASGLAPIVLLIATITTEDHLLALDMGVDKVLVEPIQTDELNAWIRRLLKRPVSGAVKNIQFGQLILNADARCVTSNGTSINLRNMEFTLLEFLLRHPEQTFRAEALFSRVWDVHDSDTMGVATVRTHIKTLRRRLAEYGAESLITTVPGIGYMVKGAHSKEKIMT